MVYSMDEDNVNLFRATAIAEGQTLIARDALSQIVYDLWREAKGVTSEAILKKGQEPKWQEAYDSGVQQLRKAAAAATLCDHAALPEILTHWDDLQVAYAKETKKAILKKKEEYDDGMNILQSEVEEREEKQRKYDAVLKQINQLSERRSTTQADALGKATNELATLSSNISDLDRRIEQKEGWERALNRVQRAVSDLDLILKIPDGRVHYKLISAKQTLQALEDGSYDGIPFEPFALSPRDIYDAIPRGIDPMAPADRSPAAAANRAIIGVEPFTAKELHEHLQALLKLKETIRAYRPGAVFASAEVLEKLETKDFLHGGSKMVGSILEENVSLFGLKVEKRPGRYFTKLEGAPNLSPGLYLATIYETLPLKVRSDILGFYVERALSQLREKEIGYDGFMAKTVHELTAKDGFPLNEHRITISLGKRVEDYGLKIVRERGDEGERLYAFAEVKPTEKQREDISTAVKKIGFEAFTPGKLRSQFIESGQHGLHLLVAQAVLSADYKSLGLRRSPAGTYQLVNRPASAETLKKAHEIDADADALA